MGKDRMHVIYDCRVMSFQYTGLGRFAGELLFTLLDMSKEDGIKYTAITWDDGTATDNMLYQKLKQYEKGGACQIIRIPCRPISLTQHFLMKWYIDSLGGDIYFYPHFDLPLSIRTPSISVVHDLFPLKVRGYITKNSWLKIAYFKLMLRLIVRKANFIFAVSETTRKDLLLEVGQRFALKVGVSLEGPILKSQHNYQSLPPTFSMPENFLLYVGDRRPHKNLKRIIDLFILLVEGGRYRGTLLLVGSTQNHDFDVESYIGRRIDIEIVGNVDDATLAMLYARMDALIFLSKYEGFGLPVAEAGLFNKKMIISDGGSLPEIAPQWAYVLSNEVEIKSFISEIGDYLESSIPLDQNYSNKFTWHSTARRVRNKFLDMQKDKNE